MTVAPEAPILFFDSGVGGLSILAPARALIPTAPVVYAADSAGFPYGTKSETEIAARVPALLGRLVQSPAALSVVEPLVAALPAAPQRALRDDCATCMLGTVNLMDAVIIYDCTGSGQGDPCACV